MQTQEDLNKLIASTEQALADAEQRERERRDARVGPLTEGDFAKVETIEEEIGAEVTRQLHLKERLTLLRRMLDERCAADRSAELDALSARTERAKALGVQLIRGPYIEHAKALAAILAKLAAIDRIIDDGNRTLDAAGRVAIDSPNACRYRPMTESTRRVTKRVGIAEPEHPHHADYTHRSESGETAYLKGGGQCPTFVEVEIDERVFDSGDFPEPLTRVVVPDIVPAPPGQCTVPLWNGRYAKPDEDIVRAVAAEIDGNTSTIGKLSRRILGGSK